MEEDMGVYFFDISNNFRNFGGSKSLLSTGIAFLFVGGACLINGIVGLALGGVKHFGRVVFFNQHWINIGYGLTGILLIMAERQKKNFLLFASITFVIMSICMSIGVAVSDCINLHSMVGILNRDPDASRNVFIEDYDTGVISAAIGYNSIDLLCNLAALGVGIYALWRVYNSARRYFSSTAGICTKLVMFGGILSLVSIMNLVTHLIEAAENNLFANYTLDQPFWLLVAIASGLTVMAAGLTGSRPLTHVGLLLCLLCYFPTVHFMNFEYRWISHYLLSKSIVLSEVHLITTRLGLGLNLVFLFCSMGTCGVLGSRLANQGSQWFELNRSYSKGLRQGFVILPTFLIIIGWALLVIDIVNSSRGTLYRVIMASDQKLPFSLIPAGVITILLNRDSSVTYLLFPLAFALCATGLESAVRNVKAFLFVAHETYFPDHICIFLALRPKECKSAIELSGTNAHFSEALLSFIAMVLLIFLAVVVGRIMGIYGLLNLNPQNFGTQKQRVMNRQIVAIRTIGGIHALIPVFAVILLGVSARYNTTDKTPGITILQNYVMFPAYYVTMICTGISGLVWASYDLYRFPLRLIALMMLNAVRITELFIYLDYRTVNGVNVSLALIIVGELVSLGLSFSSIILCGHLLTSSTQSIPEFDFADTELDLSPSGDADVPTYNLEASLYNQDVMFNPTGVLDMRDD